MTGQSTNRFKNQLLIDKSDSQGFFSNIAGKLRKLLPDDVIEISSHQEADGVSATLDISGYLSSPGRDEKSQRTIASIVLLDTLSEKTLETAYELATAINLPGGKTSYPIAVDADIGGVSVFILSRTASCSLEDLAVVAVGLNSKYASELWPDAIGVCDRGLADFSAFVPGRGTPGSFFLSRGRDQDRSEGAPSVTVSLIVRASNDGTFAKVAGIVAMRCGISLRDSRIPNSEQIAPDFPSHGLAVASYQYNLAGQLRPQIFEQSLAAQLPGNQFVVESNNERLGSIRILPWQDGAVIKMSGKFPIEPFLAFLCEVVPSLSSEQTQFFRHGELQISYVLPITNADFLKTLQIFDQRSSNMRVRWDDEKHIIEKVSDEGLSSKFVSRLRYGVLALRDAVFFERDALERFDQLYDDMYNDLQSVREARDEVLSVWRSHKQKFDSGKIVSRERRAVHITENIDRTIRRETENIWNAAVRVIKQSTQMFLREHGLETDFLFRKASAFESRIKALQTTDAPLADYLEQTRQWTEPLILLRNEQLEHGRPIRLKVEYDIGVEPIRIVQPSVAGVPLTEHVESIFDRCCVYVEDLTAHCIKQKLPPSLTVTEIPKAEREEAGAVRFSITISPGGAPEWTIYYADTAFEDR